MRSGYHVIFIVPEQASFMAEHILSSISGSGLINVEVLSVERLCEQILQGSSRILPYLSEQGLAMTTRRIAEENSADLIAFPHAVKRQGFCKELADLFSTMKRASVTPEILQDVAENLDGATILKDKLLDISKLYAGSDAYLASRYLTSDDRVNAAIRLMKFSLVRHSHVYIQEFPAATNQLYSFFEELLLTAESVSVGILDDAEDRTDSLFAPMRSIRERLLSIAEKHRIPHDETVYKKHLGLEKSLIHLENHLFSYPYNKIYAGTTDHIHLYEATSRQSETDAAADAILEAVRGGFRYRDIVLLASDLSVYQIVLKRSFELRNIPFFLDQKRPILSHPAAELVQDALAAISGNYAPSDMLTLVKNCFCGISRQEAESFENYVLRYGIRGNRFLSEFNSGNDSADAENARKLLLAPLTELKNSLRGRTVREKLTAVYDYLVTLHLPEQLKEKSIALAESGRPREATEHAEIWKLLTELLDQLYMILGDTAMSRDDFLALIREGLASITLGAIPDTADRVLIGDTERTIVPEGIKMLLILGANDGMLPANRYDDSIINNAELQLLASKGLPVWDSADQLQEQDMLHLYSLFATPNERLYVSFSYTSDSGELQPSPVYLRLKNMFPGAVFRNNLAKQKTSLPSCARTGLRSLSDALREDGGVCVRPFTRELLAYYYSRSDYAELAGALEKTATGIISPASLDRDLAEALYKSDKAISASRLEQFNQCAFRHFIKYGLKAEKRKEQLEEYSDLGSFYHAMLQAFLNFCSIRGINIHSLDEQDVLEILDSITPSVKSSHHDGIFLDNVREKAGFFLNYSVAKQSILAMVRQIQAGDFDPVGAEVRFGDGCAFPAIPIDCGNGKILKLAGIIDRVDKASVPGSDYLRVIDYKTGGRSMDFAAIQAGINLQLPLYLSAVTALSGVPAAMYYMTIKADIPGDSENAAESLEKSFLLNGLTVSDEELIRCTDHNLSDSSSVLNSVSYKKDGTLTGSICTETEMSRILVRAKEIAGKTGRNIYSGKIEVGPMEKACKYCDYKSICRFETALPSCRVRKKGRLKRADFLDSLTAKEKTDELV